jgi:hypothetical protein
MSRAVIVTLNGAPAYFGLEIVLKVKWGTTAKGTVLLVTLDKDAVILVLPIATPVARPAGEIVAIPVLELLQVTAEVMSAVEASE